MKHVPSDFDRRQLLRLLAGSAGACALPGAAAAWRAAQDPGRALILLQLSGGNDGLSTVVPYADDVYAAARRRTRIAEGDVLKLDDYRGLHPALSRLRELWGAGALALVEGVGYPGGIRSHFKSLEVWHTARLEGRTSGEGWVGRLGAELGPEGPAERVVHLGASAPYALFSLQHPAVALTSPTTYRWFGGRQGADAYRMAAEVEAAQSDARHSGRDRALARVRGVLADAQASSARIRAACAAYRTPIDYPRSALGAQLHDAAAILQANLGTRVISTEYAGFDTHAEQRQTHDQLMAGLDAALGAFLADLARSEVGRGAVVVAFSEFGRRVRENGSAGTDHGKAGPLFVLGHQVRGGLHGVHPDLAALDSGDLAFTTDFRSVYAGLLQDVLGVEPPAVLGEPFVPLQLA